MKPKECAQCGCARRITVVAKVSFANREIGGGLEMALKRMCFPCLLKGVKLMEGKKFDLKRAMECVGE